MIARFLALTTIALILAPTLSSLYVAASLFGFADIVNIGIINTIFAVIVGVACYRVKTNDQPAINMPSFFEKWAWIFLPSLLVLGGSFLLVALSRWLIPSAGVTFTFHSDYILMICWIPVIEELVFRVGFGGYFRHYGGNLLGGYLSALFFSVMHTMPTTSRIWHGDVGAAIGPFVLGLICEFIYVRTKMVTPIIVFHMACNATALIFNVFDPRWLDWMSFLYG